MSNIVGAALGAWSVFFIMIYVVLLRIAGTLDKIHALQCASVLKPFMPDRPPRPPPSPG